MPTFKESIAEHIHHLTMHSEGPTTEHSIRLMREQLRILEDLCKVEAGHFKRAKMHALITKYAPTPDVTTN